MAKIISTQKLFLIGIVTVTILIGTAVLLSNRSSTTFADNDAFSKDWKSRQDDTRYQIVGWILNAEPSRSTTYPVETTRLNNLTRDKVILLLGPGDHDGGSYFIGTIEDGVLENLFVPKNDYLGIRYDTNDIVAEVYTVN